MKGNMERKYPIWKFHKEKSPEGLIVQSHAEYLALGAGWVESPADFDKLAAASVQDPVESAALAPVATPAGPEAKKSRKPRGA